VRSERAFLAILILLFVVKSFVPAWSHLNTDFPNYYLGARLYRAGYPVARVYEWQWFQRQKDHLGIDQRLAGFIPLTLPSILPVMPLSSLPALQAKRVWLLVNLLLLLLIGLLLKASTKLAARRIALLMFLTVVPLRESFLFGQMHILVLLLLTFAAWLYFNDWQLSTGVVLAIAAAIKIYPALFLILFLFKRQWRAVAGLLLGLAGALALSLYLFGRGACQLYAQEILPRALSGEVTDPYNVAWNSFTAVLRRLFIAEPELNPAPVMHAPWLYAFLHPLVHGFILIVFLWAIGSNAKNRDRRRIEWATFVFLLLLLSSQPGSYHFVALILTVVLVVDYLVAQRQTLKVGFVCVIYALICGPLIHLHGLNPTGWATLMSSSRLALMVLFAGILLWIFVSIPGESPARRFDARTALLATSVLVVFVTLGFISNMRHLRGQFENYKSRVVTVPGSALAADPVVTSEGLFFSALVPRFVRTHPDTYAVHEVRAGSITSFAVGGDWFHPAVVKDGNLAWAEVATGRGSQLVRFSPLLANYADDIVVETENAEQPVVSNDGQLLAFIRPVMGRGSLWIRQISDGSPTEAKTVEEHQIADSHYDVRDIALFPDHRIIFSSGRDVRFGLFEVSPGSGVVEKMIPPTCSARYPAISPDGQWIAFSCEQKGSWQIHTMNLRTKQEVQLTNADCNSVTPAWTLDSKELIYATDCGRGLGLTALAKLGAF
jgi:Glycosyltransferase family 87/WD40-like Beta Propeller Repeat